MKRSIQLRVKNKMGLHARPAALIAQLLKKCQSEVSFSCHNKTINAKSVMEILLLAASKNTVIQVTAEGKDAEATLEKLTVAFDRQFEE